MKPHDILDAFGVLTSQVSHHYQWVIAPEAARMLLKATRAERRRARHARMCKGKHGQRRPR